MKIDLTCDMDEPFGRYQLGSDLCLHDDHLHAAEPASKVRKLL